MRSGDLNEMEVQKGGCICKQSYGLCERGRGWEDLGEWH